MNQVTKAEFFSHVGQLDVSVSCEYFHGCPDGITSTFKTRSGSIVGTIKGQLLDKPSTYHIPRAQA